MKKLFAIVMAIIMFASVSGVALAASPKPGTDFNGAHFNLNIIGVPHDKLNGNFDNANRHTIFIPLYTDYYNDPCLTTGPNSNRGEVPGTEMLAAELPDKGVRLRIGPSTDGGFSVIDGNATDDKYAEFLMPATPNGYNVYVAGKGKPGGCLDVDAYNSLDGTTYYFIGHVDVDRKTGQPKWQNINYILYRADGLAYFADPYVDYFWQLYNNGLRLMQVRFYPTAN